MIVVETLLFALDRVGGLVYILPVVLLWIAWNAWMFIIRPQFYRDEIDIYPYNIPCELLFYRQFEVHVVGGQ